MKQRNAVLSKIMLFNYVRARSWFIYLYYCLLFIPEPLPSMKVGATVELIIYLFMLKIY